MYNYLFQAIDSLHSEWERMDKSSKLGWLAGEKMRLNGLANQFTMYLRAKGGILNDYDKAYANKLLNMIDLVDTEGSKVTRDLANDAFKEIVNSLIR